MTAAAFESDNQSTAPKSVALFWTDLEGKITFWPPAAECLLGWNAAELIGAPPPFIGRDSMEVWRHVASCVRFGASVRNVEIDATTSDGATVALRFSCGPARTLQGETSVLFIVCRT